MELGGWDREQTKQHYIDTDVAGECTAYKKMKLVGENKFHGRNLFSEASKCNSSNKKRKAPAANSSKPNKKQS